jgi:hypothetical protein
MKDSSNRLRWSGPAAILLSVYVAMPVRAQDHGLEPLLFAGRADTTTTSDVKAQTVTLYRFPLAFHLRDVDTHAWGLRITFPVSMSSVRLEGVSSFGSFVRKLGIAAVAPGLELEIPVGGRTLIRPFGEVGIGKSRDSQTETIYGVGVRARTFHDLRRLHLTYGGAVAGRKTPALVGTYERYASFEAGIDAQVPLGFSLAKKPARGGLYTIGRAFNGLELQRDTQPPFVLRRQLEAGVSFSTEPDLRVWKVPLPWLAAGYQFGHIVSGVRIYVVFPF